MNKKYKIIIFFLICLMFNSKVQAATKVSGISNFPSSYQGYLETLSIKHPNWKFEALYTGLDWNYVIDEENVFGKNLVPINYSDNWKNKTAGEYNVEVDEGWVDSSKEAVEYCMDPRNFLNEVRIFQFEDLSYDENTNDLSGIEKILYGTEFYEKQVSYLDSSGNTINMSEKYSELILKAGKISKVNSYHLASRIKQEVGPFLSHNSISGNVEGFEGLYNFYNIGATSSVEPLGAIKNGLQYAKDGKGAKEEIKIKYLIPWNTKDRAITGGAIFIGSSYINIGQNTIYLQKFDVEGDTLFWHQYMTNVLAPYNESKSIYTGYNRAGILDNNLSFIIPVFDNMPEYPTDSPSINLDNFSEDNKKVYCNATNVNIRTGPSASYEIITTVTKGDKMKRLKKGNSGWDKVILENGIIGYIYQTYVTEESYEIDFGDLKVEGTEISGIYKNTVLEIKQKIKTDFEIQIVNSQNKVLGDAEPVGTGSKILVKENGEILEEYNIILYGDVNGDGKINSIDLLKLQRHILEIEKLEDIYVKAGNVRKTGKVPSSVDLLLIQRHILGLQEISQ
jgi:beta-N-acetylglucosaminidase